MTRRKYFFNKIICLFYNTLNHLLFYFTYLSLCNKYLNVLFIYFDKIFKCTVAKTKVNVEILQTKSNYE